MPQPIDPNTEIMRTAATERIQQIADRASLAAQARATDEADDNRVDVESQVQQANQKSEQVESELRRKNPYMGRRRRKKKKAGQQAADDAAHTLYTAGEQFEVAEELERHDLDVTI